MQQRWMYAERVLGRMIAYISFASVLIDMTDHASRSHNAIRQNIQRCMSYLLTSHGRETWIWKQLSAVAATLIIVLNSVSVTIHIKHIKANWTAKNKIIYALPQRE